MEEIYKENPEIITNIFDMMEKFTDRFEFIENQLWKCDKTMKQNQNTVDKHETDNEELNQNNIYIENIWKFWQQILNIRRLK